MTSLVKYIVKIDNCPSRNETFDFVNELLKEKKEEKANYKIKASDKSLSFIFTDQEPAMHIIKGLNVEKIRNRFFKNIKISFSLSEQQPHFRKFRHKRFDSNISNSSGTKSSVKDYSSSVSLDRYSSYNDIHMRDITSKAGVISIDNPYGIEEKLRKEEERNKRMKNISGERFNGYFDKATNNKNTFIKNYVTLTPSLSINDFKYREEDKSKWVSPQKFWV